MRSWLNGWLMRSPTGAPPRGYVDVGTKVMKIVKKYFERALTIMMKKAPR
jgi:hypothetical protein